MLSNMLNGRHTQFVFINKCLMVMWAFIFRQNFLEPETWNNKPSQKISNSSVFFLSWYLNWHFSAITCSKPPAVQGSEKLWSGEKKYNSFVTYRCYDGYFIKPGLVQIRSICSGDATWQPSPNFKCTGTKVDCGIFLHQSLSISSKAPAYL